MRWTGWILAATMFAGCVGQASGGQPGCAGCVGGSALWQPNVASLSGEACCSPNGYAGVSAIPGCCCSRSQTCCDNAWDGYCDHHAKVQAFWSRVGTPKVRSCPRVQRRVPAPAAPCVEYPAPTAQPTPAVTPVQPRPPVQPTPAADATPALPTEPPVPSEEASGQGHQLWVR